MMEKLQTSVPPVRSSLKEKQKNPSSPEQYSVEEQGTLSPHMQSSGSVMEKESTPSPTAVVDVMINSTTSSPSEISQYSSQGSSDENEVPRNTCWWSVGLIDKFGIRKEETDPDKIWQKWRICLLTESELDAIDAIVDKTCLEGFDFNSLEDIPFHINIPFKTWGVKWFEPRSIGIFKTFNESLEEFRFHLYNTVRQVHLSKKRENQELYEIGYQVLFEKLLRCVEFRTQSQLEVPKGKVTIFGQEVFSKADIVGLKCDDPSKILFVCEEKSSQVKRKGDTDETEYSPVKKKLRSSANDAGEEATSSTSVSISMPSNVYAQHIGELLAYLECSVTDEGLLGMVIQKTNVMFTYLKIDPESMEKIKGRKKPGSVKLEEDPVFYYTKQFNMLRKEDRRTIFKTLITLKMMEKKVCNTFS